MVITYFLLFLIVIINTIFTIGCTDQFYNNKFHYNDIDNKKAKDDGYLYDSTKSPITNLLEYYKSSLTSFVDTKLNDMNKYWDGLLHLYNLSKRYTLNKLDINIDTDFSENSIKNNVHRETNSQETSNLFSLGNKNKINRRNLQIFNSTAMYNKTNCNNDTGVNRDFIIGTYMCNGNTVTKSDYDVLIQDPFNKCTIVESEKTMCICNSNFEGKYCQMPITNLCAFSTLELNNVNLLDKQNTFYEEYLKRKKIFLDEITDSNRKLYFTFALNCRLMPHTTEERVQLTNSSFVNFKNEKQIILRQKEKEKNGDNFYTFNEFFSSNNKEVVFRSSPESFTVEVAFYDMNKLSKTKAYHLDISLNEIFDFMTNKTNKSLLIDYNNSKQIIERGLISGAVYFQVNFLHKKTNDGISELDQNWFNRNLVTTYVYNGSIGVEKNLHLNFDYANYVTDNSKEKKSNKADIIFLSVFFGILLIMIAFLIKYCRDKLNKKKEEIKIAIDSPVKERLFTPINKEFSLEMQVKNEIGKEAVIKLK